MKNSKTAIFMILAMLLISLGFNGYFILQKVKAERQADIDWGKRIIRSYYDATMFSGMIRDAAQRLLEEDSLEQRLSYKYQIGLASQFAQSIPELIAHAERIKGSPFQRIQYTPQHLFVEINNALGSIASKAGNLTDDEVAYLKTTEDLFEQVDEWLKDYQIENTADELALQMIEDKAWIDIAEQINDLFATTPDLDYLFTYRSTHD